MKRKAVARAVYREGDWFAVPLNDGHFAIGIITRANRHGVLLGYFFGPAHSQLPPVADQQRLTTKDAILVRRFGHLGLQEKRWPIIGRAQSWNRDRWPVPTFVRYEELTGRYFSVMYDNDDPNRVVREQVIQSSEAAQRYDDGLSGAGSLEARLSRLLGA